MDKILEIACLITDDDLNLIAEVNGRTVISMLNLYKCCHKSHFLCKILCKCMDMHTYSICDIIL